MNMTLRNLLGISLDTVVPDRAQAARLLAAAERNLADAQLVGLSAENRFDAAYKSVMQLAMLALHVHGYRTLTSRPGHHQTAIQSLPMTVGLSAETVRVLDALRRQRNLADYSGDPIPESTVRAWVASATDLLREVTVWVKSHKPELL
jgi:hypothetical protein